MANKKITDLGALLASNADDADVIEIVDVSANGGAGTSFKMTVGQLRTLITNALIIGTDVQAWAAVLDATTASFTTALKSKLDAIEALADVTDEANVTDALDGSTLSAVTVATGDKVLIQDLSDTDTLKTVTAVSIAALAVPAGSTTQLQYNLTGAFAANPGMTYVLGLILTAQNATDIPLTIQLENLQSGHAFDITSFGGAAGDLFYIDATGNIQIKTSNKLSFGGGNTYLQQTANTTLTVFNNGSATAKFVFAAIRMGTSVVTFASSSVGVGDVGITRQGAGILKITAGASGDGSIYAGGSNENFFAGDIRTDSRIITKLGADVASATNITLGASNTTKITGTTTINTINGTGWTESSTVVLHFDSNITLAHNTSGTGFEMLLSGSGNYNATANDNITLQLINSKWLELTRTVI